MKEIVLSQGKVALVDDSDYEWINQWKWYAMWNGEKWYAVRHKLRPKRGIMYMHRVILGDFCEREVDHRDNNGLNNQRYNLRAASSSSNKHNRTKLCTNTSGFKGVSWHSSSKKWAAEITAQGRKYHLGVFSELRDAAIAYNDAALNYHGEFAFLNQV